MDIPQADQAAIREVVEQQLLAFQNDDAFRAFSFASPGIRRQFGTVDDFMQMVKTAYYPVYRPRSVVFEAIIQMESMPAQPVVLMAEDGNVFRGVYLMECQTKGDWRIAGCYLMPIGDPSP